MSAHWHRGALLARQLQFSQHAFAYAGMDAQGHAASKEMPFSRRASGPAGAALGNLGEQRTSSPKRAPGPFAGLFKVDEPF